MNILVSCLLLAVPFLSAAQADPGIDQKRLDLLLTKVRAQEASAGERGELQQTATTLQNNGQQLDEQAHNYKKSLECIDKAITLYYALSDTLNLAFARKYKGHLLVRLDKLSQAKAELRSAVNLYQLANTGAGVASSQFDLARVFEFESKNDSAIYYANASREYWEKQQNSLQLLVINNMMVYHLLQLNQTEKAEIVYHESEKLLQKQSPHWQPLLDFYYTAMVLFRQTNDMNNASHYRALYLNRIEEIRKQGITARSYYETLPQ